MVGGLSLVQGAQGPRPPGCGSGPEPACPPCLLAYDWGAALPLVLGEKNPCRGGRPQCLAQYLWPVRRLQAPLLQPANVGTARRPFALCRPGAKPGTGAALASAQPFPVPGRAR